MSIRRIFSGIQPSGVVHLGNYLGAIRQWVSLQDQCDDVLFSVVDLHSLTVHQAPLLLKENIKSTVICLLACGVDPKKSLIFQQSKVPQHAELAWILGCATPTGWLNRMTQWKAKAATDNRDLVGLGLFAYPVLMSADILLYGASHVPVGNDQVQHLELTRDIASSFNSAYGPTFELPTHILGKVERVMSLRNPLAKMNKSDNQGMSCVYLTDSPDTVMEKIKKAVTDCTGEVYYDEENRPGVSNLIRIYSAMTGASYDEIQQEFAGKMTVDLKIRLGEVLAEALGPIREEADRLEKEVGYVNSVLVEGAQKATEIAHGNLNNIKTKLGLL